MKYRREIDGLRAVAVIPVILFHAGFETFSGGFVGVDIFFVISGYLITTIILSDIERGAFSLVNFYERRTRRILPALFLVMFVCLPFAWFWLLPSEMQSFSQSLIAVSTFSSNIFFWKTSDYWGIASEFIPLLHTWSLAVEEQYYLIFPLFLMIMWRFGKRWILGSFLTIAAASLLLAEWGATHHPTATFYFLFTRGWELAIGASIAFYFLYKKKSLAKLMSHPPADEALTAVGLMMIGYSVVAFDENTPFPGIYALVPTVGTGLIIVFSSSKTLLGRLLGVGPLVAIGLISYSAYLWHQPLFAFARYRSLTNPGASLFLVLSALSIAMAYLSWRYVEKPFRTKGLLSRKTVFTCAAAGSTLFIAIGMAGSLSGGWAGRFDEKLLTSLEAARLDDPREIGCLETAGSSHAQRDTCTLSAGDGKFAYLLGDSHAAAMAGQLRSAFDRTEIGLLQGAERGCPPVLNVFVYVTDKFRCFNHNKATYDHLQESPEVEYLILIARWVFYLEGTRFDNREGGVEPEELLHFAMSADDKPSRRNAGNHHEYFLNAYTDSVTKLVSTGKKVILVYPIPEAGWDVPRYIRNSYANDPEKAFAPDTGSTSYEVFKDRNRSAYQALDNIGAYPNLVRIYPEDIFCNSYVRDRCVVQKDDSLLYRDDDHLSSAGAKLLADKIMSHLN